MRSKLWMASLALLVLGVAGCGGGSNSASSSVPRPTGVSATHGAIRIYRLKLAGAAELPLGAPDGVGDAVVALHDSSVVCWRFAHLHGFTDATIADIRIGATGKSGKVVVPLSTGSRLHHRGCVPVRPALLMAIEHSPHAYYVNIDSVRYPSGALRAQL
jgi:hypothetical protein